jgi:hypothetical protein
MYGIVNRAIQELVVENHGEKTWDIILRKSNVDVDFFISTEPYEDAITFKLAKATSEEIGISLEETLVALGEWWVIKTTSKKYPGLMSSGGENLKDFLLNLPNFHNRIMLMYPKLTPPEFKISNITSNSIDLHYFSKREGLQEFVRGLLLGIGKLYNSPIDVDLLQTRLDGSSHEIFKVSW